jgi:hypothetical protein
LEKAWNQAYKLGDKRALDRILDDQIVLINDDGTQQTKADFLASVEKSNSQEQQVAPESMSGAVLRLHNLNYEAASIETLRSGLPNVMIEVGPVQSSEIIFAGQGWLALQAWM